MAEKRQYKRLGIKIPVKWRSEGRSKQNYSDAFLFDTRNITAEGLFLKTPLQAKKGLRVALELFLSDKSKPTKVKGRVMWLAKKGKYNYLYPGIGIKFENVSREKYKRLNAFMRNKFSTFQEARELKSMYLKLKNMASKLVELEEKHSTATHFKKVINNAINEIDDIAHILDREIEEIKRM